MHIFMHIDSQEINMLPSPPHSLRRCWNPSPLEDCSVAEYNKKRSIQELYQLFRHVEDIKKNIVFVEFMQHIISKKLNMGYYYGQEVSCYILSFILNVHQTSVTNFTYKFPTLHNFILV